MMANILKFSYVVQKCIKDNTTVRKSTIVLCFWPVCGADQKELAR